MKKPVKTAAKLMAELNQNPEYVARQRELAERSRRNVEEYREAAAPLLAELAAAGFVVQSVSKLHQKRFNYESVVPLLVKWLPLMSNPRVKESIVRALSVPFAQEAAPLLVEEFRRADPEPNGLKWAIGNALDVVGNDAVMDEMIDLATDQSHGKAREMVVSGLGNMKDRRVVPILIDLLKDEEVFVNAMVGLARLGATSARSSIEPFLKHPKPYVRKEAKKAIEKIDKVARRLH
jgi:HEAT repeat protein